MSVEVIGGEVEERPALGGEGLRVLELEARRLADHRRLRRQLADERRQRRADVPGDRDRLIRRAPDVPEQFRDGRLAVGAGDRAEAVWEQPPGELELADHRQAPLAGRGDRGRVPGHPGALDHAAHVLEPLHSATIQDDFDAGPLEPCRARRRGRVNSDDPLAPRGEHAGRRLARPRQSDHQIRARRYRWTWLCGGHTG